jgi:hypothetical protein
MPNLPPRRQFHWLCSGRPFIPEFENSGFSGRFYKISMRLKWLSGAEIA